MGYQQHPGDLWDGLEPTPEPPEKNNNRTLILVIGGIGLLLGLVICLVAGYLFLLSRTGGTETAEATEIVVVPPGEGSKSFPAFETVAEALLEARIERNDAVLAFGGGVVGFTLPETAEEPKAKAGKK